MRIVFRTDVIERNAGYRIAIDCEFIAKTMLSSICQFLRLLKMRVASFKCPRHFTKKVCSHNFVFTTRLIYFSHFLEIFILNILHSEKSTGSATRVIKYIYS